MGNETHRYRGKWLGIAECNGWEYATRTNARGVAVIIAVTDHDELLLVEQYRIPVRSRVLELPAGLAGDGANPDEDIRLAGHRELLEETGYAAGDLKPILICPSSAGLSDEIVTFFVARQLRQSGPGGGDASEDIEVHAVPLDGIDAWLLQRQAQGILLDPKIYSALYLLRSC